MNRRDFMAAVAAVPLALNTPPTVVWKQRLWYAPSDAQLRFLADPRPRVFYGGASGCGRSETINDLSLLRR